MQQVGYAPNVGAPNIEAGANAQEVVIGDNPVTATANELCSGVTGAAIGAAASVVIAGATKVVSLLLTKTDPGIDELPTKALFASTAIALSVLGAAAGINYAANSR